MTTWSQDIYTETWQCAAEAHQGQTFPGTTWPYIVHISTVAMEVMAALAVETMPAPNLAIQCALLHDVIEDTPTTYQQVAERFGPAVADGVLALTKDESLPDKRTQMMDSLTRIQQQPHEIWQVKLADRIANLNAPPHYWTVDKIKAYQVEARLIHEQLHPASAFLSARLQQKIEAYQQYIDPFG